MSVRNTNHVAVLITADEVSIITAPVARADHSWAVIVISDLCMGLQLHEQGVHPVPLWGIVAVGISTDTLVGAVLRAAFIGKMTAPACRAHALIHIATSDLLGGLGMLLHENGVHPGVDLRLLDQGEHLGTASGPGLDIWRVSAVMANTATRQSVKAEQRIITKR